MKTCFKNFTLIDGNGGAPLANAHLIVDAGMIQTIGTGDISPDCTTVDLNGCYVMPGLIDCHTHIVNTPTIDYEAQPTQDKVDVAVAMIKNLENLLRSGVVYIRDCGGYDHSDIAIKKHVQAGTVQAPDLHVCGKILTMTGGHAFFIGKEVDGADEMRKAVRVELKSGVDAIKVISTGGVLTKGSDVNAYQLNVDELRVAVEEAHKAGKKVCTHAHGTLGIKNAIRAGIDSIEHATLLDDEAIALAVAHGTYIVPTFAALHAMVKYMPDTAPQAQKEAMQSLMESHSASIKKAYLAGIPIAMGTDSGTPFSTFGKGSALELELMHNCGMSTQDVITSATKTASELIGIQSQYGTLDVGKYANLLVLNQNPLDVIQTVQSPQAVYKKGVLVI